MPRINPLLLLKTLSVLLGSDGGIKESEDVQRVVNLMVRFSKKLVSKCIYVQILLATKEPLLDSFYTHGGWELVTGWFTETCERENWRLLEDMLHLFKMSPVTIERLKTNQCPKQVKHLSKDSQCEVVKELALEVVDLWMKVIKGEPKDKKRHSVDSSEEADANNWKMEIRNGICVLKKVDADAPAPPVDAKEEVTAAEAETKTDVVQEDNGEVKKEEDGEPMDTSINADQGEDAEMKTEGQGDDKVSIKKEDDETGTEKNEAETASDTEKSSTKKSDVTDSKKESQSKSSKGKKRENSSSRSDSRDSKRKSDSSRDKRKGSSKSSSASSSSSSRSESKKSSSRHSSKDSSRHRDHRSRESEKQREREKEKEREKRKQSEKDKETLALVTGKGSLGRLGAIPKKAPGAPESKPASSPMAESKAAPSAGAGPTIKKAGAAPEPRKPTAKVFGAKFRSTGLLDAAPTSAPPKKKPEVTRPKPAVLPKRLLPEPTSGSGTADKRQRIEQRPPVERPGGIKVIPPKPLQLQEATGFMDALNSSKAEKKKSVRRVRRLSSKDDDKKSTEEKKQEEKTEDGTPEEKKASTPTSPVTKPLLKFYQDTQAEIEEEEERERREKEVASSEETAPAADGDAAAAAAKDTETPEKADAPAEPEEEARASTPTIPLERRAPEEPGQRRGVLVYHRSSSRRKLSVSWKPERDLVAVQYFEMDENERVNVNRAKFLEMQTLEKTREREHMRRARMERDDGMSEQMPWQMLILVDRPPALVTPGARSAERVAQEQRELTSLPAFLNPSMMPDSASEPDPELHEPTPCKPVPLEDDQGDANVKDFSADGWPEARPEPRHLAPPLGHLPPQANPHMAPSGLLPPPHAGWGPGGPMHPDAMAGPMEEDMPPSLMPPDLMSGAPMGMHPGPGPGFGGPQMMPPGGGWGPLANPNMMVPGHMMGPPVPNMMMMGGPGPHFNSGGGPGFRGGWRSAAEDARPPQRDIPCRHFNNGHCRKGMSCNFLHSAPRNGSAGGRSGRGRGGGRGWKERQAQHDFV